MVAKNHVVYQRHTQTPIQITQLINTMAKEYAWAQSHTLPVLPDLPQGIQQQQIVKQQLSW